MKKNFSGMPVHSNVESRICERDHPIN